MIFDGQFVSGIDLVDICIWAFTLFFIGLVIYLQRESNREGYPIERDVDGKSEGQGVFWFPTKKTFRLPHNQDDVTLPPGRADTRSLALKRMAVWPGAPHEPTGDPMKDGVGPASWAERQDVADITDDGRPRIVPFRAGGGYEVASQDPDPRGMTVYGADGKVGGIVKDLWIDQAEAIIRYIEIDVGTVDAPKSVLLPMPFALVSKKKNRIDVNAIMGHHFADVPQTQNPDTVTRLEEDKISGYYGGGKLYAHPSRTESQF
ncbi:MAG: photosynthetic reaction center subunit H [Pseudomonadota bacterium]